MAWQLALGCLLALVIAYAAYRVGALTVSGAWAAVLVGSLIFGLGGMDWTILILTFFVSSSLLSGAFARQKKGLSEKFAKGHRRDWSQVAANGGLGAGLAIIHALLPATVWPWLAYAGAMAAVNADTWATELGVLSPTPPRRITDGALVARGASGGVTLLGSLAALAGAALVGAASALLSPQRLPLAWFPVLLAGMAGSFGDSLLGATVQAIYNCPACMKETERHPTHTCGTPTVQARGWSWLNNDWVNFACSLVGALFSVGLSVILF